MKRWLQAWLTAAVVFFIWWAQQPQSGQVEGTQVALKSGGAEPAAFPWGHAKNAPDAAGRGMSPEAGPGLTATSPLATVSPPVFRTSAQGHLLINEQARIDMERVVALNGRADALALLDSVTQNLGGAAQREVRALYEQMVGYEQALSTALANEPAQASIEDARRQFQVMRVLRAQHFGDNANALFQDEEAQQLRLLNEIERAMQSNGISLEAAIEQAQARLRDAAATGLTQ